MSKGSFWKAFDASSIQKESVEDLLMVEGAHHLERVERSQSARSARRERDKHVADVLCQPHPDLMSRRKWREEVLPVSGEGLSASRDGQHHIFAPSSFD